MGHCDEQGAFPIPTSTFPARIRSWTKNGWGDLADIVKPDDQVLFFFSGHGVNDKSGESYLLPIDAQIKDPTGTGIDLQENDIIAPLQNASFPSVREIIATFAVSTARVESPLSSVCRRHSGIRARSLRSLP